MRIAILSVFIFLFISETNAFRGENPSPVQAVCRITLTDGKSVEGFLKLGVRGYSEIWMNGFYVRVEREQLNYDNQFYFSFDFKWIQVRESSILYPIHENSNGLFDTKGKRKIYFLQYIDNSSVSQPTKTLVRSDTIQLVSHYERKYFMTDKITLYLDVSAALALDTIDVFQKPPVSINRVSIPVQDIASIEIMDHPGKKWLDKIDMARKKSGEYIKQNPDLYDSTQDDPLWFHEMIHDSFEFDHFREMLHNVHQFE
ncbi:MAG: hypothetical protein NT126_09825 [Bacteroidetes bacterium]|nr:hypothetical protein [Bacteroidota bacterium]